MPNQEEIRDLILQTLDKDKEIPDVRAFVNAHPALEYKAVDGVCRSLAAVEYVKFKDVRIAYYSLTAEAQGYLEAGSPEYQFLKLVPEEGGRPLAEIQQELGKLGKLAFGKCMGQRWIKQDKKTGLVTRAVGGEVEDVVASLLRKIAEAPKLENASAVAPKQAKDLKKRKLLKDEKLMNLKVTVGPRFSTTFKKQVGDLTKEMLDG